MTINKSLYSSTSTEWETPQDLFDKLNERFKFTVDVCATAENAKCKRFFTAHLDGLTQNWNGERVWCNPPYGRRISEWVRKCSRAGLPYPPMFVPAVAVMLLPARTDTRWWHDYVIPYGKVEFIRGRLKFGGSKNSAPFPSAIVVFRREP